MGGDPVLLGDRLGVLPIGILPTFRQLHHSIILEALTIAF